MGVHIIRTMKNKRTSVFPLVLTAMLLMGCRATQPVVWDYHAPMVPQRGGRVSVSATCDMPDDQLKFLRQDVQYYVSRVLKGKSTDPSAYQVDVVITRYEPGSTGARLLTFGMLGRIHLEGTVLVRTTSPPEDIGRGHFEKWYGTIMPFANLFASMERTVTPKVGLAVSRAIEKSVEKGEVK